MKTMMRAITAMAAALALLATSSMTYASAAQLQTIMGPPSVGGDSWSWYRYWAYAPSVSDPVGCNPNGGVAPYSYTWVRASGDGQTTPTNPYGSPTSFNRYMSTRYTAVYFSYWKCTVTDSLGQTATSNNTLQVTFEYDTGA